MVLELIIPTEGNQIFIFSFVFTIWLSRGNKMVCLYVLIVTSQPPLLSSMVYEIYNVTKDEELVKKAIPVLLKEYKFWNSG